MRCSCATYSVSTHNTIFDLPLRPDCGFVQLVSLIVNFVAAFLPNGVDNLVKDWGKPGHIGAYLAHWPTDFTRDILPIPCHSHNDYWRDVPLYSAIQVGVSSVEADIWAFPQELYVGHSLLSLTPNRTLNNLYINPLLDLLDKMNPKPLVVDDPDTKPHGVFDTDPSRTLIFLIDFKTYGPNTWPAMYTALDPLRERGYLTHVRNSIIVRRPITVVGTGSTPFSYVNSSIHNPHQDVFFDAPLNRFFLGPHNETTPPNIDLRPRSSVDELSVKDVTTTEDDEESSPEDPSAYTPLNSYYASISFHKAFGNLFRGQFSDSQLQLLRGQIKGAQAQGLKVRYWDTPFWPIGLRNHVWDVLVKEGVDFLNVDDLKAAAQRDWGRWKGWWRHGMRVE